MQDRDWPSVSEIYAQGIATGYATFETEVPEFEKWKHDQREGIRHIQKLMQELSDLTRSFMLGFLRELLLQTQLHNTSAVADNLHHRLVTTVKWLRLEKEKIPRELHELDLKKKDLLS